MTDGLDKIDASADAGAEIKANLKIKKFPFPEI